MTAMSTITGARPTRGQGRLLAWDESSGRVLDLRSHARHLAWFGELPALDRARSAQPGSLIDEIEASGLRGRGGGWFPAARKWRAVLDSCASRRGAARRPEVIVNAMEGEPASHKDATLIGHAPHLVLDGAVAAAVTLGARRAHIAVHRGSAAEGILRRAIDERGGRDAVTLELITPPARYVASEESALAHWAGGGLATPVFGERPFSSGMKGRPTLVQNAETLAHVALIARYGAPWFREVGHPDSPGTTLVTIGGAVRNPGVVEVPTGIEVPDLLLRAGGLLGPVDGFLTGGYGGAWVDADRLLSCAWEVDSVRSAGGVLGAGVLWAMDPRTCPLVELDRVLQYMAGESAGQCGPCRFGLPSLADDLHALAHGPSGSGDPDPAAAERLERRLALVVDRGGCRHPDGVARFASTGLAVFSDEVQRHRAGHCSAPHAAGTLPVPPARPAPVSAPGKDFA